MVESTRTRINASDYYQLPEYEQHDLIQLIDGEFVIGMPPVLKHQDIVREILILLTLIARQVGGKACDSPIEVYLDDHNVFEPDVLYIKPDNLGIAQQDEKRIVGAPNLVVEVLSPSTAKFDRQDKYQAYEQHGVDDPLVLALRRGVVVQRAEERGDRGGGDHAALEVAHQVAAQLLASLVGA